MVKTVFWAPAGHPESPVTSGFAKLSYEQLHFGSSESLRFLHSQWGPLFPTLCLHRIDLVRKVSIETRGLWG